MSLNKTQRLLLLASTCWFFGEGLLGPLFTVFAERVGGDLLDITYAWALFLITSGVLYIVFGKLFTKSNRKKEILVFGYALNTVFTFGYLLVHNSTQLFILQILLAIAEAICSPIWDAIFAKELDEKDDVFFWSVAGGHTHLVSGIAIAIGGLIAYYISFEALFVIMGIIQAIATIIQWRLLYVKPTLPVQ
jgi:MFS family permease